MLQTVYVLSQDDDIREMEAESNIRTDRLKLSNYLIQKIDSYNFLIHRELQKDEYGIIERDRIFEYQGKKYLWCISNFSTEEEAEIAIKSYWTAIKQLNKKHG